jgi:hypothetical protein
VCVIHEANKLSSFIHHGNTGYAIVQHYLQGVAGAGILTYAYSPAHHLF